MQTDRQTYTHRQKDRHVARQADGETDKPNTATGIMTECITERAAF